MPPMRKGRRPSALFRVESLEPRTLLSVVTSQTSLMSGPWALQSVNAATALFVQFKPNTSASQERAEIASFGGRVMTTYPNGPQLVQLAPWASASAAVSQLQAQPDVVYAEVDATVHDDAIPAVLPNDPQLGQQWALTTIDAPQAWAISTGKSSVIVAVLDTGLDTNNPDFAGRLWTNPTANSDGFFGDVHGWNFVSGNGNIMDNNGHGTHVTGILAATGNNGVGVAGVNWGAQIMPLKVLDSNGNGSTDTAVSAIYFAVQHGAKVINASWGGDIFSATMLAALQYANQNGVVFVTAAGNESSNNDQVTTYPASYRTPNELVVAAIDPNGSLASYSNFGPSTVDIAAPGTNVLSTVLNDQYQDYTGTSMSTPFVAGTVALLAGLHPSLTATQLVEEVKATAKPDPALTGLISSGGIVDPFFTLSNITSGSSASGGPGAIAALSLSDVEFSILTAGGTFSALSANPSAYITLIYQSIVGRTPSPSDLSYQLNAVRSGVSYSTIIRGLQGAPEAHLARVARWYQDELGSTETIAQLESNTNVQYWAFQLSLGISNSQVEANIFQTGDYLATTNGTTAGYVSGLYTNLLAMPADPTGVANGINLLSTGTSQSHLVQSFLAISRAKDVAIARLFRDEFGWTSSLAALMTDPGAIYWASQLVSA
jgi:thermitase